MVKENQPIIIPNREPGEGSKTYRRRLSRIIPKRETIKIKPSKSEQTIYEWREKAYDLVIAAYQGWVAEEGEVRNDNRGMNVEHGSSAPDSLEGKIALEHAYHLTYGKQINTADFLDQVGKILTIDEARNNIRYPLKADFLTWAKNRAKEMRQEDNRIKKSKTI